MMDADDMGLWLKGDKAPRLREVLHPKMLRYYESLDDRARCALDARRPVGPALHASISDALNNFASHVAPNIVKNYSGTIIYSGGDDVLVMLPSRCAVPCADALQSAFRGFGHDRNSAMNGFGERRFLSMGANATMSAGIAFVHIKEDLRLALLAAREAEKAAKTSGKNALALRFMRRSGERSEVIIEWNMAAWFHEMVSKFENGAPNRWTYRLRSELTTLMGEEIPRAAIESEIRRLVDRANGEVESMLASHSGSEMAKSWHRFSESARPRDRSAGESLADFITACQGASFIARGNDG